ncbi:MAG: GNAT family N-acetyltransferase [Alphaproteobacteria bacterium]|nr:GNAT family N-acetyltransferase [Alphaproteobacteria bacterium]
MQITKLKQNDYELYNAYVLNHKHGLLYYTNAYREFLEKTVGGHSHYLVAKNAKDAICGVFPLMCKKGEYGDVWNALPFYGSHGSPLADSLEIAKALFHYAYANFLKDSAACTIVGLPFREACDLEIKPDYKDHRIGQWTPLKGSQDDIFELIDSSTRRNVRKAHKEDIEVSVDNEAWDFLQKVHVKNMQAIGGKPKSDAFFEAVKSCFKAGDEYNIYVAYKDGQPVSALLIFYCRDTVEYFVPATVHDFRNSQPSAAIILQAMMDAAQKGYKWWNWGGTWESQEGVYKFKKKWGAEDRPYHYYTCLKNKDILSLSAEKLLKAYPDFYVLPFSTLKES